MANQTHAHYTFLDHDGFVGITQLPKQNSTLPASSGQNPEWDYAQTSYCSDAKVETAWIKNKTWKLAAAPWRKRSIKWKYGVALILLSAIGVLFYSSIRRNDLYSASIGTVTTKIVSSKQSTDKASVTNEIQHSASHRTTAKKKFIDFAERFYAKHPFKRLPNNKTEMQQLSDRLLAYSTLYNRLVQNSSSEVAALTPLHRNYSELERQLFPFLANNTALQLQKSLLPGRGVAVCVNSRYLRFVLLLIRNLRLLNSSLPIEVFYKTGELQAADLARLREQGVVAYNIDLLISQPLDNFNRERYAIKPFALLFGSYAETMLIDADVVFYQTPDLLFDNAGYLDTGTLMFRDRYFTYHGRDGMGPSWFDDNLPQPLSDELRNSPIYLGLSNYFVESGVVVVDKRRGFVGTLAICRLMTTDRELWFGDGDQEAFWLGFELLHQKYFVHRMRPGLIGWQEPNPRTKVMEACGNLLHPGDNGRPLWSNGGIVDKTKSDVQPLKFDAFAIEKSYDTLSLGRDSVYLCLEEVPPVNLTSGEMMIYFILRKYLEELKL